MLINISEVLSNDSKVLKKQAVLEMGSFLSREVLMSHWGFPVDVVWKKSGQNFIIYWIKTLI